MTSLCPCSKHISDYGAHNQRSHITIKARVREHMWIEELIDIAEQEASCELFGILKRPDEKYVTERAYDNPKFVEDIVRDVAVRLNAEERIPPMSSKRRTSSPSTTTRPTRSSRRTSRPAPERRAAPVLQSIPAPRRRRDAGGRSVRAGTPC